MNLADGQVGGSFFRNKDVYAIAVEGKKEKKLIRHDNSERWSTNILGFTTGTDHQAQV